ncbi:Gti1/Pac2 family-domain-containing protein [Massariosphaeria phaeospora]|uniref:Gti1/Pac2 family-domain-containing protein n=1 Tax=Massariosphaeria phaeospora TaxID=100035 RepID=A0A7C8MFV1_9PLEO|nr:Gti1/Pac2 family-domain-containing protein [Massariosphaeria phaeospora]
METYTGHVRTPQDAIILFEACRIGLLPRVQRRLSEKERQQIGSGSVFVWDEREAGMRRWTDGKSWSASRVSGSFLTYREMEGKRGGAQAQAPKARAGASGRSPEGSATGDSDPDGPDGYRYKPDGLMKQSFSITTSSGQHLHLISYYSRSATSTLQQPTNDAQLRHIRPPKNMYPESTSPDNQTIPAVTRSPMQNSPYAPVPHQMTPVSPYGRPGPTVSAASPPFLVPYQHPHTPPNIHPGFAYPGYFPPGTYPYPGLVYQPYGGQTHVLDRPPPPISNPNIPHPQQPHPHMMAAYAYPGHPAHVPYYANTPVRNSAMEQHQLQAANHHRGPPPTSTLLEQGPQLPAINATAPLSSNKPPTPQPSELRPQESLSIPEASSTAVNKVPSPIRTIPTLVSILNKNAENGAEAVHNQAGSRSGSRSPNSARPLQELPAAKLASNSLAHDSRAVDRLNKVFSLSA